MKILLVTRSFYRAEALERLLPHDEVISCFRDYHFEGLVQGHKPDLIVSDGTCKTRYEGECMAVYFDPQSVACARNITVISWWWFNLKTRVSSFFSTLPTA